VLRKYKVWLFYSEKKVNFIKYIAIVIFLGFETQTFLFEKSN